MAALEYFASGDDFQNEYKWRLIWNGMRRRAKATNTIANGNRLGRFYVDFGVGSDIQDYVWLRSVQEWIASSYSSFYNPDTGTAPFSEVQAAEPSPYTLASFCSKTGLNNGGGGGSMFRRVTSSGTSTHGYISPGDVLGIWLTSDIVTAMNYMYYIPVECGIGGAGDVSGEWQETHYYNNQQGIALVPETPESQYSVDDGRLKAAAAEMCYEQENGDAYGFNSSYGRGTALYGNYYFQVVHIRQSIPAPTPPMPGDERRKREWYAIYHSPCTCPYVNAERIAGLYCGFSVYAYSIPVDAFNTDNGSAVAQFRALKTIWHPDGFVNPQNGAWTRFVSLSGGLVMPPGMFYYRLPPQLTTTSSPYHIMLYDINDYPVAAWPAASSPWLPLSTITNTMSYGFRITGVRSYAIVYDWVNESYS